MPWAHHSIKSMACTWRLPSSCCIPIKICCPAKNSMPLHFSTNVTRSSKVRSMCTWRVQHLALQVMSGPTSRMTPFELHGGVNGLLSVSGVCVNKAARSWTPIDCWGHQPHHLLLHGTSTTLQTQHARSMQSWSQPTYIIMPQSEEHSIWDSWRQGDTLQSLPTWASVHAVHQVFPFQIPTDEWEVVLLQGLAERSNIQLEYWLVDGC